MLLFYQETLNYFKKYKCLWKKYFIWYPVIKKQYYSKIKFSIIFNDNLSLYFKFQNRKFSIEFWYTYKLLLLIYLFYNLYVSKYSFLEYMKLKLMLSFKIVKTKKKCSWKFIICCMSMMLFLTNIHLLNVFSKTIILFEIMSISW